MEAVFRKMMYFIQLALVMINLHIHLASAEVGVVYGLNADNLPSKKDAVKLMTDNKIELVRLHQPHAEALRALRSTNIKVAVGVKLEDIAGIANDPNAAQKWVNDYIFPFKNGVRFTWVTVGINLKPSSDLILKAMTNIDSALHAAGFVGVNVSTIVTTETLVIYAPPSFPSASEFSDVAREALIPITVWLRSNNYPLFVNVYPYEAIANDKHSDIKLNYTLFLEKKPEEDPPFNYYNAFEAMVDSFYVALEKIGWKEARLVVGETGWPNLGDERYGTKELAQAYNQGLINKMSTSGTPRRPNDKLHIFIQSMFDEDKEPLGVKRNMGIYYQDMKPVYPLNFKP